MSNYNKATNFAVKDTLTSGDPDKVVSGAEIDNEFNAISSAVGSKIDKVSAATTNNLAALNANGNVIDSGFAGNATVPSGGIIMWSGLISAIPTGWSLCDGTDGTPDLRNRFVVGAGDQYNRNDTGGQNSVQLTENEMPSHDHTMDNAGNHSHSMNGAGGHSHSMNSAGNHSHGGSTSTDGNHSHSHYHYPGDGSSNRDGIRTGNDSGGRLGPQGGNILSAGAHSHSLNINNAGSHTHNINGVSNHTHSINNNGNHSHNINNAGGDSSHENRPPYYALAYIMKL